VFITKRRIRSLGQYIKGFKSGDKIVICVSCNRECAEKAVNIGFTNDLSAGERVLPKDIGNITRFNSKGKEIPLKDKAKETHFRQQEWQWKQFRGRYGFEEKSKIVDIPYERYPRKGIEAPSFELMVAVDVTGSKLIVSDSMDLVQASEDQIIHVINLFLEVFGACEIRNEDLDAIIKAPVKNLNWDILPLGKKPWGELQPLVSCVIDSASKGNRVVIDKRFEAINSYEPDFVAVGRAGFSGYLVFGFLDKSLYVLESTKTNNATYIIENDWERLSGLTKAEILNRKLHKERVVHRESWFNEMNRVLYL